MDTLIKMETVKSVLIFVKSVKDQLIIVELVKKVLPEFLLLLPVDVKMDTSL